MEENIKCKNLLLKIEKELRELEENSLNVAEKLDEQTGKLENISENNENILYQTDVSKWYIKYLSATFGKVYRKIYTYPIRKNASNLYNVLSLKKNVIKHDLYQKNNPNYIEEKDSFDRIVNKLENIKAISKNCGDELDKHNAILEYNNKLVNNSGDKIEKNTRDIKKLLLNF
jgi:hypothetical protein